jgi:hypothetical protein
VRRYDDPVDVRRGRVCGTGGVLVEGPEQFVWRDRLWTVHAVLAQWVETGAWWQSRGARAALGAEEEGPDRVVDLAAERECWRVEAARGRSPQLGRGVFDLVLDWDDGSWRLTRCLD